MIDIGLAGAFLGGLFALLSPCSALLLPSFFAYAFDGLGRLISRTFLFYVGLALVLVPLGAGVGALGSLVTQYRGTVTLIGGLLLIVMGVLTVTGRGFSFLPAGAQAQASGGTGGVLRILALGAIFGLAGFCSGPLLGAVLTMAVAGGEPLYGGLLMAFYGLGMAVPLFALALLWNRFKLGEKRWLRGRAVKIGPLTTHSTSLISGLIFIGIGLLFVFTEGTANLGSVMGVESQFRLQEWASTWAARIPDYVFPAVAALVLAVILLRMPRQEGR